MKKISVIRILGLLIIFSFIGLGSCKKKESSVCETNWYVALSAKITAVTNTAIAYGLNQTTANCTAYKTACQDYVNALQPYANCTAWTGASKTDWQEAVNETQAEINSLTCN